MHRIDAFNKATLEIINLLKSSEKAERDAIKNKEKAELDKRKEIERQIIARLPTWNGKPLYKIKKEPKPQKTQKPQKPEFNIPATRNSNYRKIFDYIVYRKLDYGEIMTLDPQFKSGQDIKQIFANLKLSGFADKIDAIYKKHGLDLPPFSTWTAKDFNKGPSDRGELEPTNTIVYEVKRIIRNVLEEIVKPRLEELELKNRS